MLRVVVADDQPVFLRALRAALEEDDDVEVVATATDAGEALRLVASARANVLLVDAAIPPLGGLRTLVRARVAHPDVHVILLSHSRNVFEIEEAFRRGAAGYLLTTIDPRDLAGGIRQAVQRTAFHAAHLPALRREDAGRLSLREDQVIGRIAGGLGNEEIAAELGIAVSTVKFHASNAYRKLGVRNRAETRALLQVLDRARSPAPRA